MRVCSLCFSDILDDALGECSVCGAPLDHSERGGVPVPASSVGEGPHIEPLSEEGRQFRSQFEERSVQLSEALIRRAEAALVSADSELRRATIMLVDLCGFSRAGTEMSAEHLSELAERFYKICTDCVIHRGGFVVKFIGDAVLAVFGAPVAYDRDTENATFAAMDIIEHFNIPGSEGAGRSVSIGLATGPVRSGVIEAPTGHSYDVMGETVNLAARLQGAAGSNEALVCERTYRTVKRCVDFEATAPLKLKNVSDAYVAYRVRGIREAVEHRRIFDTPFVGRSKSLETLIQFFKQHDGRPLRIAHVYGEAGLGKTRLVYEAIDRVGRRDRAIWWSASPSGQNVLLAPVLDWLREEMGLTARDSHSQVMSAVEKYLSRYLPPEDRNPLLIEYLFGVPRALEAFQGSAPDRIQQNLFTIVRQLIYSPARLGADGGEPILVFDDLQWSDSLTTRFVSMMMEWPLDPSCPDSLALVLTYRSGDEPVIQRREEHLCIELDAMVDAERRGMLERLVAVGELDPEICNIVLAKAAGNPLFLEEMTRLTRQMMASQPELKGADLKNSILKAAPDSLWDLIQSRIDRLERQERRVLQCGSLLGLEFSFSLIEMFDLIRIGLREHLQTLCDMRYLDELAAARQTPELQYYFIHGLFRDVAYGTMLEETKRNLHLSLARRLEEAFEDRLQEYHEILAFHFERGGDRDKAIRHLIKAADRQMNLGGASNALDNYEEAIELLRLQEANQGREVLMLRVLTRCARLHRLLGDVEEADEMFAAAQLCATTLKNERLSLNLAIDLAVSGIWAGRTEEAKELLEDTIAEAQVKSLDRLEITARVALGVLYWRMGELEQAAAVIREAPEKAAALRAPMLQGDGLNNLGLIYWRQGHYDKALDVMEGAMTVWRSLNDRFGLCNTMTNMGIIQEQQGDTEKARASYENAMRVARKIGYAMGLTALASNLSNLERRLGRPEQALRLADEAAQLARGLKDPNFECLAVENRALALWMYHRRDEAIRAFDEAMELATAHQLAEREVGIDLHRMLLEMETGHWSADLPQRLQRVKQTIEEKGLGDLRARLLRAMALEAESRDNSQQAEAFCQEAIEASETTGNFFERIDSLQALLAHYERLEKKDQAASVLKRIQEEMERKND